MKEWLTRNWLLKIGMLILAIPVWLVLINIANPMATKTISNVEVEILNDDVIYDNDQTYSIVSNRTVTIEVTARKRDIADITAKDFRVYVDMNYYFGQDETTKAVQLKLEVVNNQSIIDSSLVDIKGDDYMIFALEDIIERSFPVNIAYSNALPDDLSIGSASTDPQEITIRAAESALASVNSVRVNVDLSELDGDTESIRSQIKLYDANGKEITQYDGLTISNSSVNVNFEILRSKTLNLVFGDVTGTAAEGYRYSGMTSDVTSITVVGLKAALADVSSISITGDCLSVEGATEDITRTIDISEYLPENVEALDDTNLVTITLYIEELHSKTYKLPTSDIVMVNQNDDYVYSYTNETALITIIGFQEDLDAISTENIIASIDVADYETGVYSVPVTIEISDEFELADTVKVSVRITRAEPETEAPETETEPEDETETQTSSDGAAEAGAAALGTREEETESESETETSPSVSDAGRE